ncbi:GAF domain-containing SpoIIE family protein phosphatase [Sulfidibacter corallicola]|uniref:GAF domain-containing SpoIIE family protein phosphatase n=1 Tax=Sulfidibacter corallicola TaxID=2818388 RepID=UPI001F01AA99|nr:SpoIIE family protein phosphatase [Sulfidibacter corallicola]
MDADSPELVAKYRFLHDRIQQTAYELMGDTGRMATHLELGRLLVRNAGVTGPKTLEAWTKVTTVFEIANHLNKSVTHISDPEEREQLMIINWIAAKKAIASVAYQEAFAYLRFSLTLLPQNAWRHDYQTALVIHNDAATAAFLSGNDAQMEHLLAEIVDNSNTDTDAGSAYDVLLKARISQNRHADALEGACSVLGRLGVDLPSDCSSEEVNREFDLLIAEIDRVGTDRISAQSKMDDCQALLAMRLLRGIVPITAAIGPSLHQLVIVRMVSLTLKRGLCEDSAMGFVSLAMLLCRRRDEDRMTQMSDMATWLSKRYPSKELQVYIDHIASTLWAWKKPLLDVGDEELEISYAAVEAGEFGIAGFALLFYLTYLSLVGKDLDHACKEFEKCLQLTHRIKQHYVAQFLQIFFQALENVRGTQENPHDLAGPHYDESVMPAQHLKNKDVYSTIYYHYNKMFLCCLFGRYQEAVDQMRPIESLLPFIQDHVLLYQVHYYYGLACLALSHDVAPAKRDILFDAADQSIEKVEWAAQWGPMNFKHKHHFLAAERAWALSDRPGARTHFKTAARLATENNHILDAGHVWERLGLLWLAEDEPEAAGVFLNRAHGAYRACGAKAKILMLEKQFSISLATNHFSTTKNAGVRVEAIDLNTFLKASRAIMGNMVLDNLLESMMVIICENVCARKGSFLMDKDGKWTVCVRYAHERGPEICSRELSDFQPGELPKSLIEFVINSKDPMVLENASESGGYLFDPYIKKRRSKSVMCVPVINQGKLLGVLFLENSLNVGVFTTQRLEVLKMLASLAAISVENATLYSRLEQKVAQRTAEVRKKNLQLVSSLTYAKRIQDAILPELENVRHVFPHSFCLFRPCGLVSGDFFWFNRYRSYAFLAVFDCTGHGVPGAFMSMIGNTLLHHIISLEGIFDPAMIFEYLNTEVRRVLKQETGQATDGMDGALCRYDLEAKTLVFCGARRPVYLNLPHQSGIVEIKGSRKSIGGRQRRSPNHFVNHEIDLVDGLTMYLCTDGFADQPNVDGKKIGTRRFKQLLNSMSGVSMLDQERVLSSQLDFFTQGIEQRDDITVLGVRF